jgi:cytochrome c peroxidase
MTPGHGFAYAGAVSTGVGGKKGTRNSPTIINAAYYTTQFWDGCENTLEKQAEGPVQTPVEMAHSLAGVVARLTMTRVMSLLAAPSRHPRYATSPRSAMAS